MRGNRFGDGYFKGKQRITRTLHEQATRDRVAAGLEAFCGKPFIVTLRNHCGAGSLDDPIGTFSAQGGGRHYLVHPTADLSVDEYEYDDHKFAGTEADRRLQVGNAVPVNVANWLAERVKAVLPQ
ncbi:hypothetical protein AB0892_23800 [Streptomyces sp. NPDC005409]|uniref:hypothetical protein n=1 Tax=Streptomyces sp. NPDC005409 TaxID=3155342 RepID=UPI0034560B07